jgi:uncharacterized protein (TIGR03083 family)
VEYAEHIEALEREASAFAAAARQAGPEAPIPSCPDWTMRELVRHGGSALRWAHAVLVTREPVGGDGVDRQIPNDVDAYPDWLEASAALLAAELRAESPDAEIWAWGADHHVRFWARRMAHETLIHRYDAQLAAGNPEPLDGALAVDGIDEWVENAPFHPGLAAARGTGETLHAHATDREGEWLFLLGPDGLEVRREHAKGDVAARGSASDLALLLQGRVEPGAVEVFGDAAVLDRWQREMRF